MKNGKRSNTKQAVSWEHIQKNGEFETMELTGKEMDFCTDTARKITDNVARAVVGKKECTRLLLCCLLCGGHALLQDVPGVGKTAAVNAFAASLDMDFRRIQCTPDMLPADILGFTVYDANTGKGSFCPGPIMSRLFLADEINRSSPKTQAALLEAMEEGRITVDGQDHILPQPFMVLATQNPIESVGTYPLPEAQMDRFMMRISFGYPNKEEEKDIMRRYGQGDPLGSLRPVAKRRILLTCAMRWRGCMYPKPLPIILWISQELRVSIRLCGSGPRRGQALRL